MTVILWWLNAFCYAAVVFCAAFGLSYGLRVLVWLGKAHEDDGWANVKFYMKNGMVGMSCALALVALMVGCWP